MAKSSAKSVSVVEGTSMDALVKEGKALARIWKQTNSLKDSTKASGFDTRLGKLLQQLKAQSSLDSGQVSRQVLAAHGIHTIDRRRRAEALWFVENEVECRDFIAKSKKGFSSLTALQAAMRKASKEAEQPTAKAEPSNVGQSEATASEAKQSGATEQRSVTVQITRSKMVDTILHHCKENGLNVEDIINDLQSHVAKQQRETDKMVKTI
jgi:hypothetical protein